MHCRLDCNSLCSGKTDRPKSENHGEENSRRGSVQASLNNGSANPFQDDHLPVWENRNSNLSSPEVNISLRIQSKKCKGF